MTSTTRILSATNTNVVIEMHESQSDAFERAVELAAKRGSRVVVEEPYGARWFVSADGETTSVDDECDED